LIFLRAVRCRRVVALDFAAACAAHRRSQLHDDAKDERQRDDCDERPCSGNLKYAA
jgi:hypothetical protein